jgi:multiple sugar transport system substrate-binding protein
MAAAWMAGTSSPDQGVKRMRGALAAAFGVLAGTAALTGTSPVQAKDIVLKMAVPDWPPTRIMQDLANERYKAKSGNSVRLEADFIPWPVYYERLAASLSSGEKKYQMAVSDSQWLGAFVEGGYYMKINQFIESDPEWQAIFKDLHPNPVAAYSTYPHKSENYYGFPQMPDVLVTYYRKDVFCDPTEQQAYQAKYGKKLPCTGEEMDDVDWDQVKTFGEFFKRGKGEQLAGKALDDDFYGITFQAGKDYDFAIMQVNGFIWQHGASIWDETKAPNGQAEGVVNSPEAVKALEHYLSLVQYMPPVVKTGTMDIFKIDELFREGKVAYNVNWIGFAESSISAKTSKVVDGVAFAQAPGLRQADGKIVRWQNIGGQPFVLTTWNSEDVTKESLDFCKWWLSTETQTEFARRGGQSALRSVYSKPEYNTFRPWNRAWGPSLDWQKDVWHVPDFYELLVNSQEEYVKAITGQQDAKTTMDNIAAFEQDLLSQAGLIK